MNICRHNSIPHGLLFSSKRVNLALAYTELTEELGRLQALSTKQTEILRKASLDQASPGQHRHCSGLKPAHQQGGGPGVTVHGARCEEEVVYEYPGLEREMSVILALPLRGSHTQRPTLSAVILLLCEAALMLPAACLSKTANV